MFFWGILIGLGVYFVMMYLFEKFNIIGWSFFGAFMLFFVLYEYSSSMAWGMAACIVVLFIIGYNLGKRREERERKERELWDNLINKNQPVNDYRSHCWNCGEKIDGSWNRKCPVCKEYYICPNCGACKCDFGKDPPYKH